MLIVKGRDMALKLPLNPVILNNPVVAHKMRQIRDKYLNYAFESKSSPYEAVLWTARTEIEDYTHRQFWVMRRDWLDKKGRNLLYSEVIVLNLWTGDCLFFIEFTNRLSEDSWLRISYETAYEKARVGDITEHEQQAVSYFMAWITQLS